MLMLILLEKLYKLIQKMKIIYEIKSLNLIITKTKEIWQLPFKSNKRNYPIKKLEFKVHQGLFYLTVKGKRIRKEKLYTMINKCNYEYKLPSDKYLPF